MFCFHVCSPSGVVLFHVADQYPSRIRPFYTMVSPHDANYSNSYDLFIRGQEICSGAQRCHDVQLLEQQIASRGLNPDHFKSYLSAFRYGMRR
jgi:aspartyl/asparaginyl-tRNA synthetase